VLVLKDDALTNFAQVDAALAGFPKSKLVWHVSGPVTSEARQWH
jgi:hypothetical protein